MSSMRTNDSTIYFGWMWNLKLLIFFIYIHIKICHFDNFDIRVFFKHFVISSFVFNIY